MPEALQALQPGTDVQVEQGKWLNFSPTGKQPVSGLIFYPGGRVDPRSYAPAARELAKEGYLVVIVKMPLNLAVLDPSAAEEVIAAYPEIHHWVIGGHSLGGAMAANFVYSHPGKVDGLALWAAYPAGSNNLANSSVKVLSISATLDGLSTPDKIERSKALLPSGAIFILIEGGNHAQFGWYGLQPGDNQATVTRQEQQASIIKETAVFLKMVGEEGAP
jgi:dienelactone hydrolase